MSITHSTFVVERIGDTPASREEGTNMLLDQLAVELTKQAG
jgi:hypothetical protein